MTEQEAAPETQVPEREIEFMGRMIWVKMPRPEQILVWQRTLKQLQAPDVAWNGEKVLAALERLRKIIDSVLLNRVDVDWLDDEMLAGTIGLEQTTSLVPASMEAFATDGNRATRRAAKKTAPAKKAVRKRATT